MSNKNKNCLPIEALSEYKVLEITNDGQEIIERPWRATTRFERVVSRIDFADENYGIKDEKNEEEINANRVPEKSWNSIREWIRIAYTEVCAFLDLISVYKDTDYMTICQVVPNDQESEFGGRRLSTQALTCLGGKKRALASASVILLRGAERFRTRNLEKLQELQRFADGQRPPSYHESLMQLRKCWRIKLAQNTLLGDVSLRCIGSRGKEGGIFEIVEADSTQPSSEGIYESVKVKFSSTMESLLNKEKCTGRLRVTIRHLNKDSPKDWFQSLMPPKDGENIYRPFRRPKTQFDRLCLAQNLLMCREIMSSLFYESSLIGIDKFNNDLIAFSSPNKVVATIFPGIQLAVSLEKAEDIPLESGEIECPGLGILLKKLIFRQHIQSWQNIASVPYPASGPVQIPLHLRGGGASVSLNTHKYPQGQNDRGLPIITNCVSGMGNTVASAWITWQNQALRAGPQQTCSAPRGQERYVYFHDWALGQQSLHQQMQSMSDEISMSGLTLSSLEHDLRSFHASPEAIACILGSGGSLLTPIVNMARHRVLRKEVAEVLKKFVREIAEPRMNITTMWNSISTPLSSAVSVTMYSLGHSSSSTKFLINVEVERISVYGVCGTAPVIRIPANADLEQELLRILKLQELRNKMYAIQSLATKFLAWVQLGSPTIPSVDSPLNVLLLASRSGNRIVCIRNNDSAERLEFLVAKSRQEELTAVGSRGDLLQDMLSGKGCDEVFHFRKVDLSRVPGQNVVGKVESLLTCLNFA